jgi:hypothetical protein
VSILTLDAVGCDRREGSRAETPICGRFTQHYTWAEVYAFLSVFGAPQNLLAALQHRTFRTSHRRGSDCSQASD